jgi:ankyrin repeat protein
MKKGPFDNQPGDNRLTMSDELLAAANKGDAQAQFAVGCACSLGLGTKKDSREASQWWRRAAEQGHPAASFNLGSGYMRGDGVPLDPWLSYLMFREAARGYKRWEQEGKRPVGLDLGTARRDARRMRLFVFPVFAAWQIGLFLASAGIGRFHMFRQAATSNNVELVGRLVDSGLEVNRPDRSGSTPLICACRGGAAAVAALLVTRGADVNIRGKGQFGATPIYAAAESGELSVVDFLLGHGADANALALDGSSALMVAALHGKAEIVRSLLDAGADINVRNKQGAGALHAAAQGGHAESVVHLLRAGADPHATESERSETPLFFAAQSGDVATMKALVDAGAGVNAKNASGVTPLHRAALNGRKAAEQYLIQAGADLRSKATEKGYTPLHVAALGGSTDAALVLLESGADVNERSSSGVTALEIAEHRGDRELVQLLRDRGARE